MGFKLIRIGKWQPIRMRFNWKTALIILALFGLIFLLGKRCDWISSDIKPTIGEIIKFAICAIVMTSLNRMFPRRQHRIATILSFAMGFVFIIFGIVGILQDGDMGESASVCLLIGGLLFLLGLFCAWRWRRHYLHVRERQYFIQQASKRRIRQEKLL